MFHIYQDYVIFKKGIDYYKIYNKVCYKEMK